MPSTGSLANPCGGGWPSRVWYFPFTCVTGIAESAIQGSVK